MNLHDIGLCIVRVYKHSHGVHQQTFFKQSFWWSELSMGD